MPTLIKLKRPEEIMLTRDYSIWRAMSWECDAFDVREEFLEDRNGCLSLYVRRLWLLGSPVVRAGVGAPSLVSLTKTCSFPGKGCLSLYVRRLWPLGSPFIRAGVSASSSSIVSFRASMFVINVTRLLS